MTMTLSQWIDLWPYVGRFYRNGQLDKHVSANPSGIKDAAYVVPDAGGYDTLRVHAFHLTDFRVSSIAGGSIWFTPREQ